MHFSNLKSITVVVATAFILAACGGGTNSNGASGVNALSGSSSGGVSSTALSDGTRFLSANVHDRVFFAVNRSSLTSEAKAVLDRQADWLKQNDARFVIEGHADERGTREYNLGLGARRSAAIKDYLIYRGVPADRINTVSFGKERPVATCSSETCWSKNRRAVTVLR